MFIDLDAAYPAEIGFVSGITHCESQRDRLGICHSAEKHRHGERRKLIIRHFARNAAVDYIRYLFGGQLAAVTLLRISSGIYIKTPQFVKISTWLSENIDDNS